MIESTKKSAGIESFLTALSGGHDRRESIAAMTCHPTFGCGLTIEPSAFECYGPATRREFQISGLCGDCQVSMFGGSTRD